MTTSKLEVIAPANEPVIITHRFIKASPALLFKCWTTPEHMKQWLGPRELVMVSCEVDLRVGGGYRYVHRAPDGQEYGFHGKYLEIDAPHRMVCTFVFEPFPDERGHRHPDARGEGRRHAGHHPLAPLLHRGPQRAPLRRHGARHERRVRAPGGPRRRSWRKEASS